VATEDIWPAIEHLAEVWGASELVQRFLDQHPAQTDDTGIVPEALRNIQASTTLITMMPLVTTMWEAIAEQESVPFVQVTDELRAYLRAITPIGHAVEITVSWVRSRLPLYPRIPVPQFASRGFRRTEEAGDRLSWRPPHLIAGLASEPMPPGVGTLLAIDDPTIAAASERVLDSLVSSAEWQRYSELVDTLTDEDVEILDTARHRVGVLLNPKIVNEYEPLAGRTTTRLPQGSSSNRR
jgi:hypothetical protein